LALAGRQLRILELLVTITAAAAIPKPAEEVEVELN
jgi:hypothetical protein